MSPLSNLGVGGRAEEEKSERSSGVEAGSTRGNGPGPVFEMVVLGSGGGPLETDCSGYLLKAVRDKWEDGLVSLEAGNGLGALAGLFASGDGGRMFPSLEFPTTHRTAVLKAAHIFSFLTCYLITHAHLDHTMSLVMQSGSVPPRSASHTHPSLPSPPPTSREPGPDTQEPPLPRPPVYGTKQTLERLASAWGGALWPELSSWDHEHAQSGRHGATSHKRKRRKVKGRVDGPTEEPPLAGPGVVLTPLVNSRSHELLHPTLPFTTLTLPLLHGCTSDGPYESAAIFIRYDPSPAGVRPGRQRRLTTINNDTEREEREGQGREFLFFGDMESAWRPPGEEGVNGDRKVIAARMNRAVWQEAAGSLTEGRLAGVFIECSYDSARPADLMFGHLCPPALYYELESFASLFSSDPRPLDGLRVFVTHIKEELVPHPSGRTSREIIMSELNELERQGRLGVEFVEVKKGDRILI